jgi:hypothetical protein
MGGSVEVEGLQDGAGGTRFTVRLPAAGDGRAGVLPENGNATRGGSDADAVVTRGTSGNE